MQLFLFFARNYPFHGIMFIYRIRVVFQNHSLCPLWWVFSRANTRLLVAVLRLRLGLLVVRYTFRAPRLQPY
jgi:hypothetical protein